MGFISKKDQIIDIKLTSYGRELLIKGILNFKYFVASDLEVQYMSSSDDLIVESLPVFEPITSNVDIHQNHLTTNDEDYYLPKIEFIPNKILNDSIYISRTTHESTISDPILYKIRSSGSIFSVYDEYDRISSLKNRGKITDESCTIDVTREYSPESHQYLIEIYLSQSDSYKKLLVSSSSFGISDDDVQSPHLSSEIRKAETFYELIRVGDKKKFSITPISGTVASRTI